MNLPSLTKLFHPIPLTNHWPTNPGKSSASNRLEDQPWGRWAQPCGESEWPGTKWICSAFSFGRKLNRIDPYHCKSICSSNFIDHRQKAGCEQVLLLCVAIPWIGSSLSNRLVDQYGKFPASNWGWVMAGGAIIYPDSYEKSINLVFAKGQWFNMACWKIDQQRFEDFPSYKSSFCSGISQLVMFDSRRTIPMFPYIIL